MPTEELLSVTEAARRLGRHRTTLTAWIDAGIVDVVTEGRRRYVKASTVADMLATRGDE